MVTDNRNKVQMTDRDIIQLQIKTKTIKTQSSFVMKLNSKELDNDSNSLNRRMSIAQRNDHFALSMALVYAINPNTHHSHINKN